MFDEARSMFGKWRQAHQDARDRAELDRFVADCGALLGEPGESNSAAIAARALERWGRLPAAERVRFFEVLATGMDPDPEEVLALARRWAEDRSPATLVSLQRAAEPPRQELLRRLNRAPGGAGTIVRMRAELLERLRGAPELAAVDADFLHLLGSWFNPGFLELRRIDWDSPARLLEQIIRHEAVHEIDGWNDLRRRLQPDRRCFAFFHPILPDEPLIFVEVALLPQMPAAIAPLIAPASEPLSSERFRVAAFYSISNCQPGLRGVNLGNFLIKRVAEALRLEFPKLSTFCTLSPVPSFSAWLAKTGPLRSDRVKPERLAVLDGQLAAWRADPRAGVDTSAVRAVSASKEPSDAAAPLLERLAAFYLMHTRADEASGSDPVARFHLGNGARLERINVAADGSLKGQRQSRGVMVNYLYDLDEVEANHERFVRGEVRASRAVAQLP